MRPPLYKRQVRADLERWTDNGLLTADQHSAILADLDQEQARPLSDWLGLLGAILIASGAVTFVAANWEDMPKLVRLAILALALGAAHALSALLFARGQERMGQAAVLLAVGLFGAAIMLIGQTYHFNADFPGGIMLWALGALGAAVLVPSRTALGAAFVLGALWTHVHANGAPPLHVHWLYVPFWGACLGLSLRLGWGTGGHLSVLAALYWIGRSGPGLEATIGMPFQAPSYALLSFSLFMAGFVLPGRAGRILSLYTACAFLALSAANYVTWLHLEPAEGMVTALTAAFGIAAAGAVGLGWRRGVFGPIEAGFLAFLSAALVFGPLVRLPLLQVALFWFGLVLVLALGVARRWTALTNITLLAFTAALLATYFQTFGSLIETAVLFVVGGIVFVGLSAGVAALTRRLEARRREAGQHGQAEDGQ